MNSSYSFWPLGGFVNLGIIHELIVFLLAACLVCFCLRLQTSKIGFDDFKHANHASTTFAHTRVWLIIKNWWWLLFTCLLNESRCLCRFCIKLFQNGQCLRHGSL